MEVSFHSLDFLCFQPQEVKVCSPDYVDQDKNEAVKDFLQRIEHYRLTYETMDTERERDLSYIQIINQGERFIVNKLAGMTKRGKVLCVCVCVCVCLCLVLCFF